MADIRSYTEEKEKREKARSARRGKFRLVKSEDEATFREKLHRHRLSLIYRVLLGLVIVGAVVVVVVVQYKNKVYTDYDVLSSEYREEISGLYDLPLGNCVFSYSKDGARCMDASGNVLWNQTYEMQSPIVSVCGNVSAIGDYNGRTIYIQNSEKQLGTVSTNLPLRNLSVACNGVVAAVLDDTNVTWIFVYDTAGNELLRFHTTMKDTGYPISVSLSPNALLCAVSYVYVDSGNLKSSVAFYNFDEYGKNQIDNLVSGFDYSDTLVPYVQFLNNSHAFAVADDGIMFYGGSQKPELLTVNLYDSEIRGVYHSDKYVGVVFYNAVGSDRYRLEIYDESGNHVGTRQFNIDYTDIVFDGNNCIIYNEEYCMITTMSGAEKFDGTFKKSVGLLIPTNGQYRYILVTRDSVETVQMK